MDRMERDAEKQRKLDDLKQRGKQQNPSKKIEAIWAEPKEQPKSPLNVFKDNKDDKDEEKEDDLPEFGAKPPEETKDPSGFELKNYIKAMNKFLDEPGKNKENQQATEESDDEEEMEEVPKVPEESQPNVDREDQLEEEEEAPKQEETKAPEPFRLDELRISVPQLKNELQESVKCFERLLVDLYGRGKFEQGLRVVREFEINGGDKYLPKSEAELVKSLQKEVFPNNEESAKKFLYESSSYLLIKN